MTSPANTERYKNHRFPGEIISHGVWLYYRFTLSYRDVQEMLLERGIEVSHEAIRKWCGKFGQDYANQLRRRRPRPGDKWHLEIVFTQLIKTRGLATGSRRNDVSNRTLQIRNDLGCYNTDKTWVRRIALVRPNFVVAGWLGKSRGVLRIRKCYPYWLIDKRITSA
jgi:hypothetical protein